MAIRNTCSVTGIPATWMAASTGTFPARANSATYSAPSVSRNTGTLLFVGFLSLFIYMPFSWIYSSNVMSRLMISLAASTPTYR